MTSNAAKKFDTDKVDLTLVPPHLKKAVARVMMYGAVKYGRDNFKEGMEHHRVLAAARPRVRIPPHLARGLQLRVFDSLSRREYRHR